MMRTLERKVQRLERENEEKYSWKKEGIKHQANFNTGVQDWISEKLRTKLEDQFGGRIPSSLEETIKAGENQLKERKHLLKIADSYGWNAAKEFISEDLARDDKEEKKLQRIKKEWRDRQELGRVKRGSGGGYAGAGRGGRGNGREEGERDRSRPRESRACYNCEVEGHLARDCTRPFKRREEGRGRGKDDRRRN
jgi:hypothetical protein